MESISDNVDKASAAVNMFDYDTGFLCTYHLMNDAEVDTVSDSDILYKIQLSQALRMNMNIAKVIAGHEHEFDAETIGRFVKFISNKTKPCYDDRYKAVLKKHPYLKLSRDYIYKKINGTGDDPCLDENEYTSNYEYYDNIDTLINDVVPMLLSYHTFHAFHRCIIDIFSVPGANGLISDESLHLLESTYDQIETSFD